MDSIADVLKNSLPQEPPAIAALKSYVKERYKAEAVISTGPDSYILSVKSAGLASNMQNESAAISQACKLDKPLRIRISY